jgi:hypothetical protein
MLRPAGSHHAGLDSIIPFTGESKSVAHGAHSMVRLYVNVLSWPKGLVPWTTIVCWPGSSGFEHHEEAVHDRGLRLARLIANSLVELHREASVSLPPLFRIAIFGRECPGARRRGRSYAEPIAW